MQTDRSIARIQTDLEKMNAPARHAEHGITRLSFSSEHIHSVKYCLDECRSLGMQCYMDEIGNLVGRLEGSQPDLGAFSFGSHLDSVRNGGEYDGIGGVVVGLETLRLLKAQDFTPRHPLQLFAFAEEEGVLFDYAMAGSSFFTGGLDMETLNSWRTDDGTPFHDLFVGFQKEISPLTDGKPPASAKRLEWYVEPHIEQGPVLMISGNTIGVVTSITGTTMTEIIFQGEANHAGSTPMNRRKDPVRGLVEVSNRLDGAVRRTGNAVGTVGKINVTPNVANVIAGEVRFTVDLRCIERETLQDLLSELECWCVEAASRWGLHTELRPRHRIMPVAMSPHVTAGLLESAAELGASARTLPSWSGHDALNMARLCPVGMIFVPSLNGGKSHCPEEYSEYEDFAKAAETLASLIRRDDERL